MASDETINIEQLPDVTANHLETENVITLRELSGTELQVFLSKLQNNCDKPEGDVEGLLKTWDQLELLEHFKSENVDIGVLKKIECHHLPQILKPFNYTTLITFEQNLRNWRESIGIPLFLYSQSHFGSVQQSPSTSTRSLPYSSLESRPQTPTTPKSAHSPRKIALSTILNNNANGLALAESYDQNERFTDKQRAQLITVVAQYFDINKLHLDLSASYKLEKEIVERFPTEKLEYYRTGKRGKIYNKFCNLKFSFKAINEPQSSSKSIKKCGKRGNREEIPQLIAEENAEQCLRSLKFDNLSSEEIDRCWQASSQSRLLDIQNSESTSEVFKKWPQYKQPSGYRFVDMDFGYLHKNCSSLLDTWEELHEQITEFLCNEDHIKEKSIKQTLIQMRSAIPSDNCRDATIMWSLHGYYIPSQKSVRKDKFGKKITTKYTIKDSQESFLYIGRTIQAIEDHIAFLNQRSESVQPFIFVLGEDVLHFQEIYVYFDSVKFPFVSFVRAVDICFKIFFLFNLKFPIASYSFWNFIESLYFSNKKNQCSKTHLLLNAIKPINVSD